MAHILLGKTLHQDEELRGLLRAWGVTVGLWPGDGDRLPGVWECDALVVGPPTAAGLPAAGPEPHLGPVAPVLIWTGSAVLTPERGPARIAVPQDGEGGLLASLQVCLAHAAGLRGFQGSVPVLETSPLRVMGHELLTPLTAIRTALEILAEEASGPGSPEPQARRARMIELALRNADRLREALDWSCELLSVPASSSKAPQSSPDCSCGIR